MESTKDKDLDALNQLVEDYTHKESELVKVSQELAQKDQQFADFITLQNRLTEQKQVLTSLIKEEMEARNLTEHETDTVILKLSPMGKYRLSEGRDIADIPDSVCEIKKTLSSKKVKAYLELNNSLPEGVESMGNRLSIKVKDYYVGR